MTAERLALAELACLRDAGGSGTGRLEAALAIVCKTLHAPMAKILELSESEDDLLVSSGIGWRDGVHRTAAPIIADLF